MLSDENAKDELIVLVKEKNYIPPSAEHDYAATLVDEFKRFLGMRVERPKHLEVKILAPAVCSAKKLDKELIGVLTELNVPADLEHVRDVATNKDDGVFGMPALIIDGEVKSVGKVPLKREIKKWIEAAAK